MISTGRFPQTASARRNAGGTSATSSPLHQPQNERANITASVRHRPNGSAIDAGSRSELRRDDQIGHLPAIGEFHPQPDHLWQRGHALPPIMPVARRLGVSPAEKRKA